MSFIRLPPIPGVYKVRPHLEMTLEAAKEMYSQLGVAIQRETGKFGGRPLSDAPRCPCGEMTLKCAEARAHKCTPEGPILALNKRGMWKRPKKTVDAQYAAIRERRKAAASKRQRRPR